MKKVLVVGSASEGRSSYLAAEAVKNKLGEDVVVVALNAESDVSHLIQELSESELVRDFDNLNKNVMQIKPLPDMDEPILQGNPLTGQELRRYRRAQERKAAKKWK